MKQQDSGKTIKVAIADDHALFRTGVKTSLSAKSDIQMVAEAENGMQLLNLLKHVKPDVVLLDIQMPIMDGLATLPEIKKLSRPFVSAFEGHCPSKNGPTTMSTLSDAFGGRSS